VLHWISVARGDCRFGVRHDFVQGFDGLIGVFAHDPAKTYGPFVLALVNFAALVWLLRSREGGHAAENSN
jgi:hypothetical protein